jgi:hypothetical protein
MKALTSGFENFYTVACSYLSKYHNSSYHNSDSTFPKMYSEAESKYSSKKKKGKKQNKKHSKNFTYDYIYNKQLLISRNIREGNDFTCDGRNSFLHKERSKVRVATRRQKFFKPPEISTDFFNQFPEFFSEFPEFKLNEHLVVEGCYDTNKHTIQEQMNCKNFSGGVIPSNKHYNKMKTAIRDTIRKLKIEDLGGVDICNIRDFDFNLKTKPGFRYEHYMLKQTKFDCVNEAVFLAEERYSKILKASKDGRVITHDEIIPGIYTIGARNKRETDPVCGENATSRAVHMPEFHVELHGGIFSDVLTTHFTNKAQGPIFIGNSFLKGERLGKLLEDNYCAIEGDWRKFDSSLCNSFITMAVSICRLYFPLGLVYDNHFLAILDSLVIKDYHIVGGKVYRILHGLPSGSKWTSIIGSIINLLVLNYSFSSIKYYDRSFAIGGDDFVVFIKNDKYKIDILKLLVNEVSAKVGMTLKIFKTKMYKNSVNVIDYPVFYKYTWFDGKPIIPVESILERVFSPWNKKYISNFEVLDFLDNVIPSLGYPTTSCFLVYYFYIYVYFRATGKIISVNQLILKHTSIFHKMYEVKATLKEIYSTHSDTVKNKRNVFAFEIRNKDFLKELFNF